ncbi:MAG: D-alanyl-lipoteichoic acid biosynthesis protein DltD, partial [Clostridium sp.]
NVFPFKGAEYDVSIYGTAHTQSLQQTAMLGSMSNLKSDDKIALIVSAQWFQYEEGISPESFSPNFSEQQFYKIFSNDKLSEETKKAYAERTSEVLGKDGNYIEEKVFSELYSRDDLLSKIGLVLLKPYYNLKEYMLDVKDKVQTIKSVKNLGDKVNPTINEFDFEQGYIDAENEGASKVTNNDINVEDSYYDQYLRERYPELKGYWKDVDLLKSKEVRDFELFLDASKDLGVKPLIILMPVNGLYYDYIELTKEERDLFYDTIEKIAVDKGFDVLNLQNKEYEKYYLTDVMHLGWKGWLNVDEEIYKYFNK